MQCGKILEFVCFVKRNFKSRPPSVGCTFQLCALHLFHSEGKSTFAKDTPEHPQLISSCTHLSSFIYGHFRSWDIRQHNTLRLISGSQARGGRTKETRRPTQRNEKSLLSLIFWFYTLAIEQKVLMPETKYQKKCPLIRRSHKNKEAIKKWFKCLTFCGTVWRCQLCFCVQCPSKKTKQTNYISDGFISPSRITQPVTSKWACNSFSKHLQIHPQAEIQEVYSCWNCCCPPFWYKKHTKVKSEFVAGWMKALSGRVFSQHQDKEKNRSVESKWAQ